MITYGVNDDERVFATPYNSNDKVDRVTELTRQRRNILNQIENCKRQLAIYEGELKQIEKEFFQYTNQKINNEYSAQNKKLSKKDLIIQYYRGNTPQDKIADAVGVSDNYVSKVLSEYRKTAGIELVSKGQVTKQRIIQCLSSGLSINKTALTVDVSPQYVCMVKKEFENKNTVNG